MRLAIAVQKLGAAVGVIVALQDDIDIVLIKQRSQLSCVRRIMPSVSE